MQYFQCFLRSKQEGVRKELGGSLIKAGQDSQEGDSPPQVMDLEKTGGSVVGQRFPEITSKSLAGRSVTLPEAAEGKVALICIAFVRRAQSMIDSWAQPFELEFGKDSRFTVYEIPLISEAWMVFSWLIDSGMRGGIPVEKHDNVITFYGNYSGYQKALGIQDTDLAYVFLLDKKGVICWTGQGYASQDNVKELIEAAKTLLL